MRVREIINTFIIMFIITIKGCARERGVAVELGWEVVKERRETNRLEDEKINQNKSDNVEMYEITIIILFNREK